MGSRRALFRGVLAGVLLGTLSGCFSRSCPCPAPRASFVVVSPDGGFVANVAAFVVELGEPSGQLTCDPAGQTTGALVCEWFGFLSVDAGSYTIQVAAPGHETVNVPVTLSITPVPPTPQCNCGPEGNLSPNVVVLTPGDGGP